MFNRTDSVLREACGKQFTGAVARIEHVGDLQFERAYGVTRAGELARPVYLDSLFDLASLTKLFVATHALNAVTAGKMQLDAPLVKVFPEWKGKPHERITLRMLLAHTSGMDSGADYRALLGEDVVQYTLEADLVAEPGQKVLYSDLGFIALGVALERVSGAAFRSVIPSDKRGTPSEREGPMYRPPATLELSIPATEDDGWRGRVQGFVHDEKAYLMGGIAGHAGLFGTASSVARLAEEYLAACDGASRRPLTLQRPLALEAIKEQAYDPVLRRGLGWALKTSDENSCGRYFSANSFGHTGFVGTCVWADPERDCSGVLLTNSVYFGRSDTRDLRAAFYEAMIEDLGLR